MTPFLLVVLAAYALTVAGWIPAAAAVTGTAAAFLFPGTAVLAAGGTPRSRVRDWAAGPALAPAVLGLAACLALLTGASVSRYVEGTVLGTGVALIVLRWTERARPEDDEEAGRGAWLAGLALAAVVAAVLVPHAGLRTGSDAWFHTAVVAEIRRAGIPPDDPYFAGLPLQYFWFYHTALLALGTAAGWSPPDAMALLNGLGTLLCVVFAARAMRATGLRPASGAWAGAMLLLGMGGLFWLFFPVKVLRVFTGSVRGGNELHRLVEFTPFTVDRVTGLVRILMSSSFMLRKFLVGTAVPWSLALSLAAVDGAIRYLRGGSLRHLYLVFLAGAGAFAFHTVVGGVLVGALAAGAGLALVLGPGARGRAAALGAVAAGALAVCLPYLRSVLQAGNRAPIFPVGLHPMLLLSLPFSVAGVAALSLPVLARWWRVRTPVHLFLMGWTGAAVLYGLFGTLPGANQYDKTTLVLFVPLALAAGGAVPLLWERWRGRRGRRILLAVFLVLFLVPENALFTAAFWHDSAPPAVTPDEAALYDWIGSGTPPEAVFLDSDDRADVLVLGPRRQYWGIPSYARQWGYDPAEMAARRGVRDAVYGPEAPARAAIEPALALGFPLYVVAREGDTPGIIARLDSRPSLFQEVFRHGSVAVFRVSPSPGTAAP